MLSNKLLDELLSTYRIAPTYPTYPPYHTGYYLEDYFYHNYRHSVESKRRKYLPIFWTTCYIQNNVSGLERILNDLPHELAYYTISQHDDAIRESLTIDVVNFSAGGNKKNNKTIPIPLVCSPIPRSLIKNQSRDLLASFVGSNTHPIRHTLSHMYCGREDVAIVSNSWSPSVSSESLNTFIDVSTRSKYMLCPRGYGLNSFRLYESFQLGCVPVIITDELYLPWEDELDYATFSVLIMASDLDRIVDILNDISPTSYGQMLEKGQQVYKSHFTLDTVCANILKRLE